MPDRAESGGESRNQGPINGRNRRHDVAILHHSVALDRVAKKLMTRLNSREPCLSVRPEIQTNRFYFCYFCLDLSDAVIIFIFQARQVFFFNWEFAW